MSEDCSAVYLCSSVRCQLAAACTRICTSLQCWCTWRIRPYSRDVLVSTRSRLHDNNNTASFTLCCIVLYIMSCRVASRRVASRRVEPRRVASCRFSSRRVASCRVVSRRAAFRRVVSRRAASCGVVPCPVVQCRVASRSVASHHITASHHIIVIIIIIIHVGITG